MSFDELLKFIHILAAVVWVGGSVGVLIHASRALRGKDTAARLDFFRQAELMGRVFMVSGIVVAAVGIWMVIRIDAWGFDQFWISFGLTVVIASALLGIFFYAPRTRQALAVGEGQGADSPAFEAIGKRIGQVATIETLFLIAVVWAMVVKPGA